MTYTFIALVILTVVTAALWSVVTTPSGWNLGLTLGINALIAVGIAVGIDALLYKITADSPLNLMSAAVFGLIVTDCYVLGVPIMNTGEILPLEAPQAFIFVALISVIGMVVFKKLVGLSGRKYVNPAAAAKLVVMIPFVSTMLLAIDHTKSSLLGVPSLAGPIGLDAVVAGNGSAGFGTYVLSCFGFPSFSAAPTTLLQTMFLEKFHSWPGGASTIAVLIVGIGFFIAARRYVKWRITVAFLLTSAIMALLFAFAYGDTDITLRLLFTLFIGSSIFLAFFMATDPATTPLTYTGQIIFGVVLAILTVLMETYMQFFGASFVALIIMNLASPTLDKIGKLKPFTETKEPTLPRAKAFAPEKVKEVQCIRCGACMRMCCHRLSPILIKQAFDKVDVETLQKLHADYCTGCGHCTFVCPARIDLRKSVLQAKGMLRQQAA